MRMLDTFQPCSSRLSQASLLPFMVAWVLFLMEVCVYSTCLPRMIQSLTSTTHLKWLRNTLISPRCWMLRVSTSPMFSQHQDSLGLISLDLALAGLHNSSKPRKT